MYKRGILTLIIVLSMLFLSSCNFAYIWESISNPLGIGDALALDEDLHTPINHLGDDRYEIQGSIYYLPPLSFLCGSKGAIEASGNYEYIGWTGDRILYSEFYGDSRESPVFIYVPNTKHTFLREDYDYQTDNFQVADTDEVICFSNDLLNTDYENTNLFNRTHTTILISSVSHPTLTVTLYIVVDGDEWYAITNDMKPFLLSEHFTNILIDNQIVK